MQTLTSWLCPSSLPVYKPAETGSDYKPDPHAHNSGICRIIQANAASKCGNSVQYEQRQHRSDSIPKRAMQQKEPINIASACRMSQVAGQLLHDFQNRAIWAMLQQLAGSTAWQSSSKIGRTDKAYIAPPIWHKHYVREWRFLNCLPEGAPQASHHLLFWKIWMWHVQCRCFTLPGKMWHAEVCTMIKCGAWLVRRRQSSAELHSSGPAGTPSNA